MNRKIVTCTLAIALSIVVGTAFVQAERAYTGIKKCSMCHRSAARGDQYGQWLSTKHAQAYNDLATPAALETARGAGVEGDPQTAPKCLKCHVTGYSEGAGLVKENGVQCESCHGAGGDYWKMSVMKDKVQAAAAGLIMPSETVCKKCHNEESPNYKAFNFDEAKKKIAHPKP